MKTTQSLTNDSTYSTLGRSGGELVLRVIGNSNQPELVRINSPKCSIGSADACTIRLNGAGIKAVHFIILRGPTETVVRRWAEDVYLNGKIFEDASLVPGDVLTFANIRVEVICDERGRRDSMQHLDLNAETRVEQLSQQTMILNERIRQLESAAATPLGSTTQAELLARLAQVQEAKQELERRIAAQSVRHLEERRQWTCDFERLQALAAKQADSQARQHEDPSPPQQTAEEKAWLERLAELEARQAKFEQTVREFQLHEDQLQQELDQRERELEARAAELERQALELEEQATFRASHVQPLIEVSDEQVAPLLNELDQAPASSANANFSFPSQLSLSDNANPDAEAKELFDTFDDTLEDVTYEDGAAAEFDFEESLTEEGELAPVAAEDSFEEHQDGLVESSEPVRDSEEDISDDDLMTYASQVADQVSDQVIDQQPNQELGDSFLEESVDERPHFDEADITESIPAIDADDDQLESRDWHDGSLVDDEFEPAATDAPAADHVKTADAFDALLGDDPVTEAPTAAEDTSAATQHQNTSSETCMHDEAFVREEEPLRQSPFHYPSAEEASDAQAFAASDPFMAPTQPEDVEPGAAVCRCRRRRDAVAIAGNGRKRRSAIRKINGQPAGRRTRRSRSTRGWLTGRSAARRTYILR